MTQLLAGLAAAAMLTFVGAVVATLITLVLRKKRGIRTSLMWVAGSFVVFFAASAVGVSTMPPSKQPTSSATKTDDQAQRATFFAVPQKTSRFPRCRSLAAAFDTNRTMSAAKELEKVCQDEANAAASKPGRVEGEPCEAWAWDVSLGAFKFWRVLEDPQNSSATGGLPLAKERAVEHAKACDAKS